MKLALGPLLLFAFALQLFIELRLKGAVHFFRDGAAAPEIDEAAFSGGLLPPLSNRAWVV
jgi:hypothetical protein